MKTRTFIIDIDGVVLEHFGCGASRQWTGEQRLLGGVVQAFDRLEKESATIILMTARKESCRPELEGHLTSMGLYWDHLIMGVGHGERVLINDKKPGGEPSARAIVVDRNKSWLAKLG